MTQLLNADEAGARLRCRPSWLRERARLREIPFVMIGGSYRWTAEHLEEITRMFEVRPGVEAPAPQRRTPKPTTDTSVVTLTARTPRRRRAPGRKTA